MRLLIHTCWLQPTAGLALLMLSAAASAGAGLGFLLDDSAMRNFDEEDGRLMSAALAAVLAAPQPDTTEVWRNARSDSHGQVTGLRAFEQAGLPCRRVQVENHARGVDGRSLADLCQKDGDWKLLGFPASAGARS